MTDSSHNAAKEPENPHISQGRISSALPIAVSLLVTLGLAVRLPWHTPQSDSSQLWAGIGVSTGLGLLVWRMHVATPAGALTGAILAAAMLTLHDAGSLRTEPLLLPLLLLCVLTIGATRFGRRRKQQMGLAEPRHGRSAGQIAANLGAAALMANAAHGHALFLTGAVAAMVEATADTLSSEVGQALGGPTFLLTTGRPVAPGTDGGISLRGSLAGLAGAVAITAAACIGWHSSSSNSLTGSSAIAALTAGVLGWIADSVLGATVERRGWLSNDGVNFSSTLLAALAGCALEQVLHPAGIALR